MNTSNKTLYKVPELATQITQKANFSESAQSLLKDDMTSTAYLDLLISLAMYHDAAKLLAFGLPKREAIWWAYVCVASLQISKTDALIQELLSKAKTWVFEPTEPNRRAMEIYGEKCGFKTPASWLAMAIFWSEGSIGDASGPFIAPPDHLTATAVAGCIMLTAALIDPLQVENQFKHYLAQGINIANNGNGEI